MGAGWSEVGVEGIPLELVYRVLSHVSLQDLTTLLATSSPPHWCVPEYTPRSCDPMRRDGGDNIILSSILSLGPKYA